jgi:hypothetical protein
MNQDDEFDELDRPVVGRTTGDLIVGLGNSSFFKWIILLTFAIIIFYFFRDDVLKIPLYIPLSVAASFLWYRPMVNWFSESATYIDLYDDDTNTWTTFRIGKQALFDLDRQGMNNTYHSLFGNERIFASDFDPSSGLLETMWIHNADMWKYHTDRKTIAHLTKMLNASLEQAFDSEATAQAEGRKMAAEAMRRHYKQLDSIFFGDVSIDAQEDSKESSASPKNE